MNINIDLVKDILIIVAPILVAFINYKSNKRSEADIKRELEKSIKEKDADTRQILAKINAELDSQKQLATWNNSLPWTNDYLALNDIKRQGNISGITNLVQQLSLRLSYDKEPDYEELVTIKDMLQRIVMPKEDDELYPYEIPLIVDYNRLVKHIDMLLQNQNDNNNTNA